MVIERYEDHGDAVPDLNGWLVAYSAYKTLEAEIERLRSAIDAAEKRHKQERGMILLLADELARYTGRTAPEMERWAEAEAAKEEA